jgi:hypothetical protein
MGISGGKLGLKNKQLSSSTSLMKTENPALKACAQGPTTVLTIKRTPASNKQYRSWLFLPDRNFFYDTEIISVQT